MGKGAFPPATAGKGLPLAETFHLTGEAAARIEAAALRGALLHDLGKANDHFQRMVRGRPGRVTQGLRHEWISAWLPLHLSAFRTWFFGEDTRLASFVLAAVLGHHLKAQDVTPRKGSGRSTVECAFDHPGFIETLRRGGEALGLPEPPRLDRVTIDLSRRALRELRKCPGRPKGRDRL